MGGDSVERIVTIDIGNTMKTYLRPGEEPESWRKHIGTAVVEFNTYHQKFLKMGSNGVDKYHESKVHSPAALEVDERYGA